MKIVAYLPNWVGDAVMATAALQSVRAGFPDAEMIGVGRPVITQTLAGVPFLDRLLVDRSQRGWFDWSLVRTLRAERCDVALLFPNSLRSAALAWISGARRRIGINRDGRGWLLTDRIPSKPRHEPHPAIDEYLRIAQALGCTTLSRSMSLTVAESARLAMDRFWSERPAGLRTRGVVTINTGGAFGPAKNWPVASFAKLARDLVDELGRTVLVVCGPAEAADAREIVAYAQRAEVVTIADEPLSIELSKAAIAGSELLITTDSGPRHFAGALGVPVITLFGPTHPQWSETFLPNAVHLQVPVECGPCQKRVCPMGHHRCMRDLKEERVLRAVRPFLPVHPQRRAA